MEEDYGMRSDQIVDRFSKINYIILSDPRTDEYAEFEYDEMNGDYIQSDTDLNEGSKLHEFINRRERLAIDPSNKEELEEMGFELEV